jgi:hypothetical protein
MMMKPKTSSTEYPSHSERARRGAYKAAKSQRAERVRAEGPGSIAGLDATTKTGKAPPFAGCKAALDDLDKSWRG